MIKITAAIGVLLLSASLVAQEAKPNLPPPPQTQTQIAQPAAPQHQDQVSTLKLTIKLMKQQQKAQTALEKAQLAAAIAQTQLNIFQREAQAALAADRALAGR